MLNENNSILIGIDIQEKLTSMLKENKDIIIKNSAVLIKAAKILNIPSILTEQYPKGLGKTVSVLSEINDKISYFEKAEFSIVKNEEIFKKIKEENKKQIVLFGIEAHICVYQSAFDLLKSGYEVFIVHNASFSRNNAQEKELAFENLKFKGVNILSVENVLFQWLKSSKHPNFKEIQALIK